jgi:hypothetical protein
VTTISFRMARVLGEGRGQRADALEGHGDLRDVAVWPADAPRLGGTADGGRPALQVPTRVYRVEHAGEPSGLSL